jgi:hypothetical protein
MALRFVVQIYFSCFSHSGTERLILETEENFLANYRSKLKKQEYDHNRTISFTTTHPNVRISLFKVGGHLDTFLEVFRNHNTKEITQDTNKHL